MPNTPPSIPDICQAIWDIEAKLDLHHWQDEGIYPWRLLRFQVYYYLTQKAATYDTAHAKAERSKNVTLSQAVTLLRHSLTRTPYVMAARDFIVMPHMRHVNGVDIYTEDLLKHLPEDNTLILYADWRPEQYPASRNITGYILASAAFYKVKRVCKRGRVSAVTASTLKAIEAALAERLGATLDMADLWQKVLFIFQSRLWGYRRILSATKPKAIFVVTGYMHPAMICAAQERKIPVIEIQHGTMTPYHLGYHYPGRPSVPYMPSQILTYGRFWTDFTQLPAGMEPTVVGQRFMDSLKKEPRVKIPKQVLVISQGTIGKSLYAIVQKAARLAPDYTFIYRLHPSEDAAAYTQAAPPENVVVSDTPNQTYPLMQQSAYVVGVYSTAVVEAMALDCKAIIVTLAGHEYYAPIIQRGDALAVADSQQLTGALAAAPASHDVSYYFSPYTLPDYLKPLIS